MARTVEQIQAELDKVTAQNEANYKALKAAPSSSGRTFNPGGLEYQYNAAVNSGDTTTANKLKPQYEAAVKAYKESQDKKNALTKELETAKTTAATEKTTSAKIKAAESVYDKALNDLEKAQTQLGLGAYQGTDKYIAAYQAAQQAFNNAQAAGVKNPKPLPAQQTPVPPPKVDTTGQGSTNTLAQPEIFDFTAIKNMLADPNNKQQLIDIQNDLVKNWGYTGKADGKYTLGFQKALQNVAEQRSMLPTSIQGTDFRTFVKTQNKNIFSAGGTGAGGQAAYGGPMSYTTITSPEDAKSSIIKAFKSSLNREPTTAELTAATAALNADESKPGNVKVQTPIKNKAGQITGYKTTGGTNIDQFLTDYINSKFTDEANVFKAQAPDIAKRLADKKIYDDMVAKAGNDPKALQQALDTTTYGRGFKEYQAQLQNNAFVKGYTNTPEELNAIAKDLYDRGVALNSQEAADAIAKAGKYGVNEQGRYTGTAGTTFDKLAATAMANGLDLQKVFGDQVPAWISAIDKGESIDTYQKLIRDVAKIGMPDNVKKLLDSGVDLSTVYRPYKNVMSQVLELSPDSIDLNDSTLRSAITAQGEVPLYDFERQLRKDNRWQYTANAHQAVSDATQKILQDFGFMR